MKRKRLSGVVLSNIRSHTARNAVLVLTVFMTVFFLSLVVFLGTTALKSYDEASIRQSGRADYMLWNTADLPASFITDNGLGSEVAIQETLYRTEAGDGFVIARATDEWVDMLRPVLLSGRLPENKGEIAVEMEALVRMRASTDIGSELTLTVTDCANGGIVTEERTFTLTGVLKRKGSDFDENYYYTRGVTDENMHISRALVCADEQPIEGTQVYRSIFFVNKTADLFDEIEKNNNVLRDLLDSEPGILLGVLYNNMAFSIGSNAVGIALIVAVFVILAAITMSGIASAFSADISQRTRQIGMLRAIGASSRQIRQLLMSETALLGLFTLPAGMAAAYGAIILGARLLPEILVVWIPVWAVAGTAALCVICTYFAAYIPTRHASRITPLQAIRDTDSAWNIRRSISGSKKSFKPASLFSQRLLAASPGKAAATALLIFAQAALVMISVTYIASLDRTWSAKEAYRVYSFGYQWLDGVPIQDTGYTEADCNDIKAVPYVERIATLQSDFIYIETDTYTDYILNHGFDTYDYLSGEPSYLEDVLYSGSDWIKESIAARKDEYDKMRRSVGISSELIIADLSGFGTDLSGLTIDEGRLNTKALDSGEEIIVCAPSVYAYKAKATTNSNGGIDAYYSRSTGEKALDLGADIFRNDFFHAGDTLSLVSIHPDNSGGYTCERHTARIGAILYEMPEPENLYLYGGEYFRIITTSRGLEALGIEAPYTQINVYCSDIPDDEMREAVSGAIEQVSMRLPDGGFHDSYASMQETKKQDMMIDCALLLLAVLLFTVTFGICSGMLRGRIRGDTRQIGTMRAVGASKAVVFRSYMRQLTVLLLAGGISGIAASALFMASLSDFYRSGDYIPKGIAGSVIYMLLLSAACLLETRALLRPVFKKSIVENIRIL